MEHPHTTLAQNAINYASATYDGDLLSDNEGKGTKHLLEVIMDKAMFPGNKYGHIDHLDTTGSAVLCTFEDDSRILFIYDKGINTTTIIECDDSDDFNAKMLFLIEEQSRIGDVTRKLFDLED